MPDAKVLADLDNLRRELEELFGRNHNEGLPRQMSGEYMEALLDQLERELTSDFYDGKIDEFRRKLRLMHNLVYKMTQKLTSREPSPHSIGSEHLRQ